MWRDWDRERLRHVSASLRCLPQTKPHEHERWCLSLRCCSKLPYTGWLKQQKSQVKGPAGLVSGESQFSGSWAAGFLLWPLMTEEAKELHPQDLIPSQRSHLQTPSPWLLGFQRMHLVEGRGSRTFSHLDGEVSSLSLYQRLVFHKLMWQTYILISP